ncbi:Transcription factor CBF/NF-Y/archaeal histone domain-containing protein [Caenorhabditis elegans]|uniref:Transcription factor CBF/NF-Y/archaeal histone domain-containing protein n=1 Tax=Caenorhabditis elegans TaxID=6239 RepID=Q9NAC5_CAEEL|nr:Transcription factor CBF/NF-Y/archaeal histone domain-containing protein [Caenorhabditis elegans]CAB61070.1 Transcription factor CBF/NF-Y/archaeal histone domain-containing protein [Caenorhabditis elegans]|eukprot:NP_497087.1 POLE (DNA POLymerase Epsilon) homolog [Caenorhabditis elegans]
MAWRKKTKKAAPIAQMSEEDVREIEEHVEELVRSQLPLGRVKKVVRMNPDVEMLNNEALQLMAKAAELFIKELSNAANQNAALEKRKTVQTKDIDKAIKKTWAFAFLEDALDGWPKLEPKKRKVNANSGQDETVVEEETIIEEEEEIHVEEEEDEELPETVLEIDENEEIARDKFAEQF